MDRGLWITWYDLPAEGRDEYMAWVHDAYIPRILNQPGVLWGAHYASVPKGPVATVPGAKRRETVHPDPTVPTGDRYILMFGAEHTGAFADPVPSALNARLPATDRRLLEMRTGERVGIMAEAERVEGPGAAGYAEGMIPAPCIQLGSYNCPLDHEEDMLGWYTQRRLSAMKRLTGVVRTRKLAGVVGWAKHAVLYEWMSLDARNKYFPTHENDDPTDMKAWTNRVREVLVHAPGSANLATRMWPEVTD